MVFEFNYKLTKLSRPLVKDFKYLRLDPSIRDLFSDPPLSARRQPPNLRSLLTSSRLPQPPASHGNRTCNKRRCQVCKHIITDVPFIPPGTTTKIRPPPLTCDSSNVVYLLVCTRCDRGNYVGETGSKFRLRFNNHKQTIRDNTQGFTVGQHYNLPGHDLNDLKCILLGSSFTSQQIRRNSETKWVLTLNTHIAGLNRDLGIISDYTFHNRGGFRGEAQGARPPPFQKILKFFQLHKTKDKALFQ
ncbi:hypothetical protein HOLleu_23884 [Holothuria leucospilota]|uniref:GIY-YIG domain-containing protein n=1 Tax=Holothuria leucospilota TaxID=206669 RepID=A0A9Q1BW19_HOLLE|nr:hypothetical protein HOLleu_23884 [Holothuria leucospilota]